MTEEQRTIASNIRRIRERITESAQRAGRSAENIALIAITKYANLAQTRAVALAGLKNLGESRPQVLWEKSSALEGEAIRWHLVGHLQRNKVAKTIVTTNLIHSVDSIRLLQAIETESSKVNRITDILLEINISGDEDKHGFSPDSMKHAIESTSNLNHVRVHGFMAMASREGGRKQAQVDFAAVRELRDKLSENLPKQYFRLHFWPPRPSSDPPLRTLTKTRLGKLGTPCIRLLSSRESVMLQ